MRVPITDLKVILVILLLLVIPTVLAIQMTLAVDNTATVDVTVTPTIVDINPDKVTLAEVNSEVLIVTPKR